MKSTYAMVGLLLMASSEVVAGSLSEKDRFIESLNSFTTVAPYITVGNKVVFEDPTKNGKPVYIFAGSPEVNYGGQVGYLPMANIVLVGKSCAECTVTVNRYSTGGEFDHFIIEFSSP